jgi:Cu-Zn family superoxide dismutase
MTRFTHIAASALVAIAVVAGCKSNKSDRSTTQSSSSMSMDKKNEQKPMAVALIRPAGAAATQPSMPKVTGTAKFSQTGSSSVMMVVDLKGLPPNSTHGIHIHEKGDLTAPDLTSAGPHYDPAMTKQHGGPDSPKHHGGDAGNLKADDKGDAHLELTLQGVSLTGDKSIIGRSVIIHAGQDDLHSNPAGNSGARIAGGVIEKPMSGM